MFYSHESKIPPPLKFPGMGMILGRGRTTDTWSFLSPHIARTWRCHNLVRVQETHPGLHTIMTMAMTDKISIQARCDSGLTLYRQKTEPKGHSGSGCPQCLQGYH